MATSDQYRSPRVSIGLPVYNGDEYLSKAIESILSQTFHDFELIICDNASSDDTESICRAYSREDPRIRYFRHPKNLGAAPNYNSTLERARAPYFRWACHDDMLHPRCLEASVDVLDEHPDVVLAYPLTQFVDAEGQEIETPDWTRSLHLLSMRPSERFARYLESYRWGGDGGPFFGVMRTEALRSSMQHGDFPSADLILIGEMTLHGGFYEIGERLFWRRWHENNSTLSNDQDIDKVWAWFDSDNEGSAQWLEWRWIKEFLYAIRRAPITPRERRRCYQVLASRYVVRHAPYLGKELLYRMGTAMRLPTKNQSHRVVGLKTHYNLF